MLESMAMKTKLEKLDVCNMEECLVLSLCVPLLVFVVVNYSSPSYGWYSIS